MNVPPRHGEKDFILENSIIHLKIATHSYSLDNSFSNNSHVKSWRNSNPLPSILCRFDIARENHPPAILRRSHFDVKALELKTKIEMMKKKIKKALYSLRVGHKASCGNPSLEQSHNASQLATERSEDPESIQSVLNSPVFS